MQYQIPCKPISKTAARNEANNNHVPFVTRKALLFSVHFFSCSLHVRGQNVWCFHCASITHSRLHAAVGQGYFRTIFPRIKQGGSLLLWCGDGMTGRANQALSFSVNMFYSFGVRASPPFFCISHWSYYSLHLAAENLSSSKWNKMNGYSMRAGRKHLGPIVLPSKEQSSV